MSLCSLHSSTLCAQFMPEGVSARQCLHRSFIRKFPCKGQVPHGQLPIKGNPQKYLSELTLSVSILPSNFYSKSLI